MISFMFALKLLLAILVCIPSAYILAAISIKILQEINKKDNSDGTYSRKTIQKQRNSSRDTHRESFRDASRDASRNASRNTSINATRNSFSEASVYDSKKTRKKTNSRSANFNNRVR